MTATQAPRAHHQAADHPPSIEALRAALRALQHIQDEQMRMWEAFYRISTWDPRPQSPASEHAANRPDQAPRRQSEPAAPEQTTN